MRICYTVLNLLFAVCLYGQQDIEISLDWNIDEGKSIILNNESYDARNKPLVFRRIQIGMADSLIATLNIEREKTLRQFAAPEDLAPQYILRSYTEVERNQKYATVFLYPIKKNSSQGVTILENAKIQLRTVRASQRIQTRNTPFKTQSILASGQILKMPIVESGVHSVAYEDLPDSWKQNNLDPQRIELFAGHPTSLPYTVGEERIDDLISIPYYLDSGEFGPGKKIYFYGLGRDIKQGNIDEKYIDIQHNIYADTNFYYLRHGVSQGRQITPAPELSQVSTSTITAGLDALRYEEEKYNILLDVVNLQGSGRIWYSEKFTGLTEKNYSYLLEDYPINVDQEVVFKAGFAARSSTSSNVRFQLGNQLVQNDLFSVNTGDIYGISSRHVNFSERLNINQAQLLLKYTTSDGSASSWLDYLQLSFTKSLEIPSSNPLYFASFEAGNDFQISVNQSQIQQVWDISEPTDYHAVPHRQDNDQLYIQNQAQTNEFKAYIVFNESMASPIQSFQEVKNQNLHSLQDVDYLIIYHSKFVQPAERLANFRKTNNGFNVSTVNINEIYNEFSSGKVDPTAIRDFIKMLYDRNNTDIRVLLFGDGSFDYKNKSPILGYPNENFIPVFESENSWDPIKAFPSDDYYALMNDHEGEDLKGALDISIGRIPVRTEADANNIVQKIIDYSTNAKINGPWKNQTLFVSDDGNYNLFLGYTERLTNEMESSENRFGINKAYVDANPKEVRSNEVRSPKTNELINSNAFEGQLIINYQGHGGSKGWSDESILSKTDLEKWDNYLKYPLLVTATCTFAGYDDPREVTAGEYALTLPDKGAIALFTTTRVVYASSNDRLSNSVFNRLYENIDRDLELGEWLRLSKNAHRSDTTDINARKFTLLGDPALRLAVPKNSIVINQINEIDATTSDSIGISALDKVRIQGQINQGNGQILSSFNGILYPVLFDKKKILKTLGQGNENNPIDFQQWQNTLYKGRTSVVNGKFDFQFIVPKDIDYKVGPGRLSLYAAAPSGEDGWGISQSIYIGGTSANAIENDHSGPQIEVYLEDRTFQDGDEVSDRPLLLVDIEDESGINVSGNGIGHDLIYYLDKDASNPVILNNNFEYELNSFSKGSVEIPIEGLEPGQHYLTIKGWDSHNNVSEKTIEFYVDKQNIEIQHLYNYPNPFFNRTEFQFENPLIGSDIDIVIDIFSISGKLVHRIIDQRNSANQLIRNIFWDGKDQWQQKLANGVYLYKLKIIDKKTTKNTTLVSKFQKMLILN